MKIVILDYGAGNIQSIKFAIKRLGFEAALSHDPKEIKKADRVVFPGVGEASSAMAKLRNTRLDELVPQLTRPVLGICLGMQLMCKTSEEGNTKGLGIFDVDVVKFPAAVKIPQIGWNQITNLQSSLFRSVPNNSHIYLVHSFYAPLAKDTVATSEYALPYSAALHRDNFYGTQFHPEKSGTIGSRILQNFLELGDIPVLQGH